MKRSRSSAKSSLAKSTRVDLSRYDIGKVIGEGAFGTVSKVKDTSNGKEYAMKVISKSHRNYKMVEEEFQIHDRLNHPNIVKIVEKFDTNDKIGVIMELCSGDLFEYLAKVRKLKEREALEIFLQICKAVEYMHKIGYSHRDLKPENIIKCGDKWKLIDFGFSSKSETELWNIRGTLYYMAPEVFKEKGFYLGNPTDVWSLGVILYRMIYGILPFTAVRDDGEDDDEEIKRLIRVGRVQFPKGPSSKVKSLMQEMLRKAPLDEETKNQPGLHTRIDITEVIRRTTEIIG